MVQSIFESLLPVIAFGAVYLIANKIFDQGEIKSAGYGILVAFSIYYGIITFVN